MVSVARNRNGRDNLQATYIVCIIPDDVAPVTEFVRGAYGREIFAELGEKRKEKIRLLR